MAARGVVVSAAASVLALVGVAGGAGAGLPSVPGWRVVDLGPVAARALNGPGEVAGSSTAGHAVVWADGRVRDLGVLSQLGCGSDMPGRSFATDVDDSGTVVGWSYCEANAPTYYAFVWKGGAMAGLKVGVYMNSWSGPLINNRGQIVVGREGSALILQGGVRRVVTPVRGRPFTEVVALSDSGVLIGNAYPREDEYQEFAGAARGFVWRDGGTVALGTAGEQESNAVAVNARGQVLAVGTTSDGSDRVLRSRVFVWERGRVSVLPGLGGKVTSAAGLNDRGQAAGTSATAQGGRRAVVWQGGHVTDLGVLPGDVSSHSAAINGRGQVVGSSQGARGRSHAFVWQQGKLVALPALRGAVASAAGGINERGQILGTSTGRDGRTHAVLWTPRP